MVDDENGTPVCKSKELLCSAATTPATALLAFVRPSTLSFQVSLWTRHGKYSVSAEKRVCRRIQRFSICGASDGEFRPQGLFSYVGHDQINGQCRHCALSQGS